MKNNLTSNIDKELLRQIKNSLFDPDGGHIKNLKEVKEIDWEWNKGKTITTITYADGEVDRRTNDEIPPTAATNSSPANAITTVRPSIVTQYGPCWNVNATAAANAIKIKNGDSHRNNL